MNSLFDPLTLRSVTFKNRVWVSPMCQYSAENGFVGEWRRIHLGSFATGGAGMIMVEATGVVPEGRISIGCPSIEDREHAEAFRPMIEFAHRYSVKMGIQLAHAGRKASTMRPGDDHLIASSSEGGWLAVSPSPIAYHGYPEPHELTNAEVKQLVQDFADAAVRAGAVGVALARPGPGASRVPAAAVRAAVCEPTHGRLAGRAHLGPAVPHAVEHGRADPFARFLDLGVGQPDQREAGQAIGQMHLHRHGGCP